MSSHGITKQILSVMNNVGIVIICPYVMEDVFFIILKQANENAPVEIWQ